MTEEQIKHMVNRFLCWILPADFSPDNGVSYKIPNYTGDALKNHRVTGTNLFDAEQATKMVQFMIEHLPQQKDVVLEDTEEQPGVTKNIGPDAEVRKFCRTIAISILEIMRLQDLTVADLATRVGCREATLRHRINNLQDGISGDFTFSTLSLIFSACDCRVNFELYSLETPTSESPEVEITTS